MELFDKTKWSLVTLTDIIELIGGGTPKTSVPEYWSGDIPWLSVTDFNNDSRWVFKAEKNISEQGIENSSTRMLEKGDIIISARGTVGALAQLAQPMAFNQSCYGIRAKSGIDQNFLYYLLKFSIPKLLKNVHGAVFDTITRESFSAVSVEIPIYKEQQQIASLLGSLDDKIELLQKENKTLEELAQTIFKRWFVDFEFPDENGKPYKSSGGKMIESELGMIPEGCKIKKIGEVFDIVMGQSPPGDSYNDKGEGTVFYQGRTEFGDRYPSLRLYTTKPARMAKKFDVLVSVRAPVGEMNQATQDCCLGRGVAGVSFLYKSFCYYAMRSIQEKFFVFESEGTVFGSINKTDFANIKIVMPVESVYVDFDELARSIDEKSLLLFSETKELIMVRDRLLGIIF